MGTDSMKKQHILIVEDDRPLADGLCRALQNDSVTAVCCHTLGEADALLAGGPDGDVGKKRPGFDLLILDVNLPDGNGMDYLQKIKEEYDICVIMLTANDMETDIVTGLEQGADDYITKPFSLAVLRARVAAQLRRVGSHAGYGTAGSRTEYSVEGNRASVDRVTESGAEEAGWVTDGAYRFHFAKMLFYHGEEQVELSKSEQKLLHYLVENKNITLSRDNLLECIWSVDAAFVDDNTLSVTMKRLRDKLGAQDRIRTVYGIGYRWE